ncbi:MAG: hypothetical protein H0V89_14885, partial [Deltaproteobacteria bacterium]|nr:hypothetical protein [Deltaproteobacteria bacterium]
MDEILFVIVGDFDGDGQQDLATSTVLGTDFWFGPFLAPAVLVTGTSTTRLTDGRCRLNAGDLDGDGADDVSCGDLSRAPARGVVTTTLATRIAWLEFGEPSTYTFGDVDGDGAQDLVMSEGFDYVRIQYGPLVGEILTPYFTAVPADEGWLYWDGGSDGAYGACAGYTLDLLPDADGDGSMEVRAGTAPVNDGNCTPNPH